MEKLRIYLIVICSLCIHSWAYSNCNPPYAMAYTKLDLEIFDKNELENYSYTSSSSCKVESFGFYKGDIVLKFDLLDPQLITTFLSLDNPLLDSIEVYYKNSRNQMQMFYVTGDLMHFGKRLNKDFLLPLKGQQEFYVRIINYGTPLYLPMSYVNEEELITKNSSLNFYNGLLYGIIILSILFNLYLWVKNRSSIHYSLYLSAFFLLVFTLQGYSYQLLWPNSPYLQQVAIPVVVILINIYLTRFYQFFYSTQKNLPSLNRIFNKINTFLPIGLLLCLIPSLEIEFYKYLFINLLSLALFVLYVVGFVKIWKQLNNELWLISISLSAFFVSAIIYIGTNFQLFPYTTITHHSLELGALVQIFLLTFAISIRFKKFRQFKIEQLIRTNRFKQHENLKLSQKVEDRKKEISLQSKVFEEHNSNILKSITYSYNVQKALLPERQEMENNFREHFLYYQPKDIVSGDFYWAKNINVYENGEKNNYTLAAVGDCTGHGIPGALISVLAINTLNQAIRLSENKTTEDLLNFLNKEINTIFNSNIDGENIRDGLDIALIAINNSTKVLHYSTAKSQILHLRQGKLTRLKTSNNPIGIQDTTPFFSKGELQLETNDQLYLLTDGYADQFGGPYGKKYKINMLKSQLESIGNLDMDVQKSTLEDGLNNWKGKLEQTDDITLLGIRI
ncbi:Serine phosphatase RsbU, regulator of sigma subunit [Lishizhenia tianjinensis]|uniref:Serine phosphatase RsbU, regulator of sigma subunit n=1 Tax=Lishizhenia tianjinensis TaxID=477690 RepID=A0A1I7BKW9_9FLAO|nr:7TM diverse intracellular signaling domain-containing protein [Lishizhenia tianjinensis]SFT87830.1 Serine phosphatase RsbU, regulator of sigma subunit [Lishizhenia tianjinensis]